MNSSGALKSLWPSDFKEILKITPVGYDVSSVVVDAALHISVLNKFYTARLVGILHDELGVTLEPTCNEICNYIERDFIIKPLPVDARRRFVSILNGRDSFALNFQDVLEIERCCDDTLPAIVDEAVYESASLAADRMESSPILGLNGNLYPYQSRGVAWMHQCLARTNGLILADEMGLGKTIQIISLLLLDLPTCESPALIVCPSTLIANWCRELNKFAPSLQVMVHRGSNRTGYYRGLQQFPITVSTYDTLVSDISIFRSIRWSYVIADEAQAIKNTESQRRRALIQLPRARTICVTGTPMENRLADLWSLSDFAIPNILGSEREFQVCFPETSDGAKQLARATGPFVIKRRLADVASDLPERINCDIPLELTGRLARKYDQIRQEVQVQYPFAAALVATGQLQLFCAHPWLRMTQADSDEPDEDTDIEREIDYDLITPKVERTLEILAEAFTCGKKVLIFSIFNRIGPIIKEAGCDLPAAFWGAINGSTATEARQPIVDAFTEFVGPGVLVLNPRAAGAGLNITAATVVIHFTQVWNPAIEAQASARAHRRGQTLPVTVYRLFYENTVERVMLDRIFTKSELANDAVPVSATTSRADLYRALSITPV